MAPSSDLDHGILAPKGIRDRRIGRGIIRPARPIHEVAEAIRLPRWQRERHGKAAMRLRPESPSLLGEHVGSN
jgi:hypothetical protein